MKRLAKARKDLAVYAEFITGDSTPEWRGLMARLLSTPLTDFSEEVDVHDDLSPSAKDEDPE